MNTFLIAVIVVSLFAGALFIPMWVWINILIPRKLLGKILFILGQVSFGGSVAYEDDGEIELRPFDKSKSEMFAAGKWVPVDVDSVYRVGWRPFAVVPNVDAEALGEYHVENPDVSMAGDGGFAVLNRESGGYPLVSEYFEPPEDGIVVDSVRYVRDIGRSGNRLLNRVEDYALRKYGGDSSIGDMWFLMIVLACYIIMFVVAWMMLSI